MKNTNELNEFKLELKQLLKKYNASLFVDFSDCSDLHGVNGECIKVELKKENFKLVDGFFLQLNDL